MTTGMGAQAGVTVFGPIEHGGIAYKVTRTTAGETRVWRITDVDDVGPYDLTSAWLEYRHVESRNEDDWYAEWLLAEWSNQ